MNKPLTHEEHEARAMLLGMMYFPKLGYYGPKLQGIRFDADTLEQLTEVEIRRRLKEYNLGYMFNDRRGT